ncbi:MAG: permease [Deltaproteobacteria bacterium]|nr:permease [Deltaproteobacteria bacterium]MBW1993134.1 permease [Deltaproteobacteria bacterium]MBW2152504.1 permease [Deltaproteobacteria bacterium]
MYYLYAVTAAAVALSFVFDRKKTINALRIALKRFIKILPAFVTMLIFVSITLFLIPDSVISNYLGNTNRYIGVLIGAGLGSIALMPGFIAYPLCGILLNKGVAYMVLSAFSTTLMMVGVMTYPVEKTYLGGKVALIRNLISFVIALVVAVATGLFFGEILL